MGAGEGRGRAGGRPSGARQRRMRGFPGSQPYQSQSKDQATKGSTLQLLYQQPARDQRDLNSAFLPTLSKA